MNPLPHDELSASTAHLSEEQIADLLAGEASPLAMQHMETCALCREEFAELDSAMLSFHRASLDWASQRASQRIHTPSRLSLQWHALPGWSAATAAAVLVAVTLFTVHLHPFHQPENAPVAQEIAHPDHTTAELAQDNQLLLQIDTEVSRGYDSPVSAAELATRQKSAQGSRYDN